MIVLAQNLAPSTWDVIAQQVPALVLFVLFAGLVFRYLERREERVHAATAEMRASWTAALQGLQAQSIAAMKDQGERYRDERALRDAADRELASECHARQAECSTAMRELTKTGEKFAVAADTLCDVTRRLEDLRNRLRDRAPAAGGG